jgi:hypothetical protein
MSNPLMVLIAFLQTKPNIPSMVLPGLYEIANFDPSKDFKDFNDNLKNAQPPKTLEGLEAELRKLDSLILKIVMSYKGRPRDEVEKVAPAINCMQTTSKALKTQITSYTNTSVNKQAVNKQAVNVNKQAVQRRRTLGSRTSGSRMLLPPTGQSRDSLMPTELVVTSTTGVPYNPIPTGVPDNSNHQPRNIPSSNTWAGGKRCHKRKNRTHKRRPTSRTSQSRRAR